MKVNFVVGIIGCLFALTGCNNSKSDIPLRTQLAQKIMLDVRYYCEEGVPLVDDKCKQPVTELPKAVGEMIAKHNLGGVILFAENIESVDQVTKLTHDLQRAVETSSSKIPLLISTDQEGGRVARLPRDISTSFSGAMAVGATYKAHGTKYAEVTGKVLGQELAAVGIHVNHAPTVDVNVNPDNPVINVRSFGEDAKVVAALAVAQMAAMQSQNVIATLKHFPGHGDTAVDSHTGLPRVDHDLATVKAVDLLPFQQAIDADLAKMIMTAHIQYPHLDDTKFKAKDGSEMIKPATMSRKILHDLLREEMKFDGVVITDALDMAGISHFFDRTQAVVETFKAGADIALMPFYVRTPEDLTLIDQLLDALVVAVEQGELDADEIAQSANRIAALKKQIVISDATLATQVATAEQVVGNAQHKALELELAQAAITQVFNRQVLPLNLAQQKVHMLMPDQGKCQVLTRELLAKHLQGSITCSSMLDTNVAAIEQMIMAADVVIAANITPQQSPVELGGLEDIAKILPLLKDKKTLDTQLLTWLTKAKQAGKKNLFISLRTPYEIPQFEQVVDAALVTYAYNTYGPAEQLQGVTYKALAGVLVGEAKPQGNLPVTIGE